MMKLTASPGSPFVRKVRIAAAVKGLASAIEGVTGDMDPATNAKIRAANPLGKIPTLLLDDGTVVYDSHVICEYLDSLKPEPKIFPVEMAARVRTLTLAALADGILEAAVLVLYERRFRPEDKWVPEWVDKQQGKVDAGLDWLEVNIPAMGATPDYGHITLACALGFLDNRQGDGWRAKRPKLAAWLGEFASRVPSWAQTEPPKS